MRLIVDPFDPPRSVVDAYAEAGVMLRDVIARARAAYERQSSPAHRLVTLALGFDRYKYGD